jgi:hypothetical protein
MFGALRMAGFVPGTFPVMRGARRRDGNHRKCENQGNKKRNQFHVLMALSIAVDVAAASRF